MTQDFICKFGESIPKYADLIVGYAMRPGNVISSIPQKVQQQTNLFQVRRSELFSPY